jgi:uncharacterized protein YutE (UPF0331/DUF86 family)
MFITKEIKNQIDELLQKMSRRVDWLEETQKRNDSWEEDLTVLMAAERALHTSVEFATDIASIIIDALVMRDPGSYSDILKVLVEEDVLTKEWFESFVGVVPLRARFIRDHANIEPLEIRKAVEQYSGGFRPFMDTIAAFVGIS